MTNPQNPQQTSPSWLLHEKPFTVCIRMTSDWHVGSGTGRPGSIDRLIARDADDLPYIPAKTLTGIWRDALERLAYGLDNGEEQGAWSQWVDVLFGSQPTLEAREEPTRIVTTPPRAAMVTTEPARLHAHLRARLTGEKQTALRQAVTFVKPGVQIDSDTGQAQPNFLRFEEMARVDSTLYASCTLAPFTHSEANEAASALLLASTKLIERLGGKRRRGAGQCEVTVVDRDVSATVEWLRSHNQAAPPPAVQVVETTPTMRLTSQPAASQIWWRLPLRLTLQTPLAVAARTLGNVIETLDYVPGTLLLPEVTRMLERLYPDRRTAIASGALQVLPATIEIEGERGLPAPGALVRHKVGGGFDRPGSVLNRLLEAEADSDVQFKGVRDGYVGPVRTDETLPTYHRVSRQLLTHNTVEDRVQRPTSDVGGVYSREAIPAGTVLRTEIRLHHDVVEILKKQGNWWKTLQGACRLGASRKDDYGAVLVETLGEPQKLRRTVPQQEKLNPDERLTVWLLSDVLTRDVALRPSLQNDHLRQALQDRLNVTLEEAPAAENCLNALIRVNRIDSWHSRWGFPRPSLVAMAAGSCVVYRIKGNGLQAERLAEVEASGIGERRGEGYGQVRFNDPLLTGSLRHWKPSSPAQSTESARSMPSLPEQEARDAQRIEDAAWREAIRHAVLAVAANEESRRECLGFEMVKAEGATPRSRPSMSQLGSLRNALGHRQDGEPLAAARHWLCQLKTNANRKGAWPPQALERLQVLLEQPSTVWSCLGASWQQPPPLTDRTSEAIQTSLSVEAVQALIDASIRAHKRAVET